MLTKTKKINLSFVLVLAAIIMLILFTSVVSANEIERQALIRFRTDLPLNADLIVNEVISEQFSSLGSFSDVSEPKVIETDHGYAVQYESVNEKNEKALTTIIPYKVDENGDLVNSFKYLSEFNKRKQNEVSPMAIVEVPSTFVDVTVTVRTYYAHYFSTYHFLNFYRHAGIEAWWSSSNSTVTVSNMRVWYDTCGDLYKYPEVMDQPLSSTKVQNDYFIRSSIERSNPIKGTVYIDGSHTMPLNRVVLLTDYWNHGGLIYIRLQYSVNGKSRTDDVSYYVYR